MVDGKKLKMTEIELLFKDGVEHLKKNNFNKAENIFTYLKDLNPKNKDILNNLSISLFKNKKYYECEKILKKLINLGFKNQYYLEFLILVLKKQDKIDDLLKLISEEGKHINKKFFLLEKLERPAIPKDVYEIEKFRKKNFKKIETELVNKTIKLKIDENFIDPPIFYYSYDNHDNLKLAKKLYLLIKNSYSELNIKNEKKIFRNEKIKIGFISEFFYEHTIEKLFKGIILKLNKKNFDTNVFYLGHKRKIGNDFIQASNKDNLKIFNLPQRFNDKIEIIRNQNLDILFYTDIGMSSELYYLTFLRLAKKQITSWGHPETTGNPNIDYFLSSKLLEKNIEESKKHYSEKLILINHLPMYYFKPSIIKIDEDQLKKKNIYSCPQSLFKFHPDFDEVIINILKKDKKSKIFLINDLENIFSKKVFDRISKKDSSNLDRLIFLNNLNLNDYINLCGKSSVLLDPFYFGAGNSFHESMFYGTKTVSMPSKFLKSRIVLGAYKQMQIASPPIVDNKYDYIEQAIDIANHEPEKLYNEKRYYSEMAEKFLFENETAIKEIEFELAQINKSFNV